MLKREITYEDFDGNEITEVFYFNLSKPELVELEVEFESGLSNLLQEIIKAEDNKRIIEIFKKIILAAYGERSEDGKRFIKSDDISEAFSQTNAYNELFMELITEEKAAANFIIGVMPKDMGPAAQKAMETLQNPAGEQTPQPTTNA